MLKVGDKLPAGTLQEYIEVEGEGCSIGPNAFDIEKEPDKVRARYQSLWREVLAA